jgi:hypothetical protein
MPNPIEKNQPILTVKMDGASLTGFAGQDIALNLRVQESGSRKTRTWLGKKDVWLMQQTWTKPRPFTRIRFHLAADAPVFANGQREQFTRIPIPDFRTWPASGRHSTHEVAIRPYDGPENGSRIGDMTLNFSWFLSANLRDIIAYMCAEMDRHAHSHSLQLLQRLCNASQSRSPLNLSPSMGLPPLLMPTPGLKILLKSLARSWFSWLFRPGNAWSYAHFLHENFGGWSLDSKKGMHYSYEVWADILYGYLGHGAGFSATELLTETGLEDAAGGLYDLGMLAVIEEMAQGRYVSALHHFEENAPLKMQLLSVDERLRKGILCGHPVGRDAAAVRIGIGLWRERGKRIEGAECLMLKKLRLYSVRKKAAPEGVPPAGFHAEGGLLG